MNHLPGIVADGGGTGGFVRHGGRLGGDQQDNQELLGAWGVGGDEVSDPVSPTPACRSSYVRCPISRGPFAGEARHTGLLLGMLHMSILGRWCHVCWLLWR